MMGITKTEYKRCDVIKISGRIDSFTAPRLSETVGEATASGKYNLVLDFEDVEYVSSAGLRVMIDAQKTCRGKGEVVLVKVPQRIYETLDLAGFVPLFKFFDDVTQSVAYF